MNIQERNKLYKRIQEKFGTDIQLIIAIEEMSELTKELTKAIRGYDKQVNFIEEIADVRIMLEQSEIIFDCHNEVCKQIDLKLNNPKTQQKIFAK